MHKSGTLVMSSNYLVMTEEEMCYLEGGITVEAVFMLGLENQLYDMISGR
ncbi:hypothetical protein SAMN02910289_01895 [Lachnospiraceae bacterium RM5]|nr:hypothetical protein SAMN02910289_01895 [Lachnospiraceae bacterium RM5]